MRSFPDAKRMIVNKRIYDRIKNPFYSEDTTINMVPYIETIVSPCSKIFCYSFRIGKKKFYWTIIIAGFLVALAKSTIKILQRVEKEITPRMFKQGFFHQLVR